MLHDILNDNHPHALRFGLRCPGDPRDGENFILITRQLGWHPLVPLTRGHFIAKDPIPLCEAVGSVFNARYFCQRYHDWLVKDYLRRPLFGKAGRPIDPLPCLSRYSDDITLAMFG